MGGVEGQGRSRRVGRGGEREEEEEMEFPGGSTTCPEIVANWMRFCFQISKLLFIYLFVFIYLHVYLFTLLFIFVHIYLFI